jgi:hypothetical protein
MYAAPLRGKTMLEVAHNLLRIFAILGVPLIIHTDNGKEFASLAGMKQVRAAVCLVDRLCAAGCVLQAVCCVLCATGCVPWAVCRGLCAAGCVLSWAVCCGLCVLPC